MYTWMYLTYKRFLVIYSLFVLTSGFLRWPFSCLYRIQARIQARVDPRPVRFFPVVVVNKLKLVIHVYSFAQFILIQSTQRLYSTGEIMVLRGSPPTVYRTFYGRQGTVTIKLRQVGRSPRYDEIDSMPRFLNLPPALLVAAWRE